MSVLDDIAAVLSTPQAQQGLRGFSQIGMPLELVQRDNENFTKQRQLDMVQQQDMQKQQRQAIASQMLGSIMTDGQPDSEKLAALAQFDPDMAMQLYKEAQKAKIEDKSPLQKEAEFYAQTLNISMQDALDLADKNIGVYTDPVEGTHSVINRRMGNAQQISLPTAPSMNIPPLTSGLADIDERIEQIPEIMGGSPQGNVRLQDVPDLATGVQSFIGRNVDSALDWMGVTSESIAPEMQAAADYVDRNENLVTSLYAINRGSRIAVDDAKRAAKKSGWDRGVFKSPASLERAMNSAQNKLQNELKFEQERLNSDNRKTRAEAASNITELRRIQEQLFGGQIPLPDTRRSGQESGQSRSTSAAQAPEIGTVKSGYEYIGGDPASPDSWIEVNR